MGTGSVESEFRFLSYKIDTISLSLLRDIGVLQFGCNYEKHEWIQNITIRPPVFFSRDKIYVCSVDTILELRPQKTDEKESDKWLTLQVGIAGLFSTKEKLDDELERRFVTLTAPAILFPFLRAACSNILASAGFGSVLIPLINMYKIGEKYSERKDFTITIIE